MSIPGIQAVKDTKTCELCGGRFYGARRICLSCEEKAIKKAIKGSQVNRLGSIGEASERVN